MYLQHIRTLPALEQPDIPEQSSDKGEEEEPHLPAHTRALCHTQHTVHRTLEFIARIRELIIHLFRQCSRIADFVADAQSKLFHTSNQHSYPQLYLSQQRKGTNSRLSTSRLSYSSQTLAHHSAIQAR